MKIILADDHLMLRQSLRQLLERENFVIAGEASDGLESLELIDKEEPDVAILDMNMPALNGVEVTREIGRRGLSTKVVILTMFEDNISVLEAFRAGVQGYVLKTQAPTDLLKALRALEQDDHYLSPCITGTVVDAYLSQEPEPSNSLTSRERQILQLVAEGNATKEIARLLNLTIKTVESHRHRLMRKVGVCNIAGLVRHAVREGVIRL